MLFNHERPLLRNFEVKILVINMHTVFFYRKDGHVNLNVYLISIASFSLTLRVTLHINQKNNNNLYVFMIVVRIRVRQYFVLSKKICKFTVFSCLSSVNSNLLFHAGSFHIFWNNRFFGQCLSYLCKLSFSVLWKEILFNLIQLLQYILLNLDLQVCKDF